MQIHTFIHTCIHTYIHKHICGSGRVSVYAYAGELLGVTAFNACVCADPPPPPLSPRISRSNPYSASHPFFLTFFLFRLSQDTIYLGAYLTRLIPAIKRRRRSVMSLSEAARTLSSCSSLIDTSVSYIYIYIVHIYIYIYIYTHTHTHRERMQRCMCVYIHTHTHACVYIYIHTHTYAYVCIYVHTHTHTHTPVP